MRRPRAHEQTLLPALSTGFLCLGLLVASPGEAQERPDRYTRPIRANQTTLALNWIGGRFAMPVTCKLRDGRTVEIEESVSIRPATQRGADTWKAVFFGIDVADAERCYNLVQTEVLDRRGVVYFTFLAFKRSDFGLRDFKHTLEDGELEYHVQGGHLRFRPVGASPDSPPPPPVELESGGRFVVKMLPPRSDGARLLSRAQPDGPSPTRRQLEFRVVGASAPELHGYYLEAAPSR